MKTIISILLTSLVLLSSCADVPDTVRDRAENSSVTDTLESKADSDLVFDTVENATKNAANVLGNKYQNIVLPESIDIPAAQKAYSMTASRYAEEGAVDLNKVLQDYAMMYVGEEPEFVHPAGMKVVELEEEKCRRKGIPPEEFDQYIDYDYIARQPQEDPEYALASEGIDKYYIEVYASGTIVSWKTSDWLSRWSSEYASYVYDPKKDDISGVSYKVAEQEYALTDALALAEDFARNDLLPFLRNDDDVRVGRIYVFDNFGDKETDNTEGNYCYMISFEHMIGGIPLSKAGDIWSRFDHMVGSEFYIKIAVPGEISSVHNEAYPYVSQKQEFDKIVTLESALKHAENVLAPFEVYKAKTITLEYCAFEKGSPDGGKTYYDFHPTWCLTLAESEMHHYAKLEKRRVLYIDALDGTVRLWDDSTGSLLFSSE